MDLNNIHVTNTLDTLKISHAVIMIQFAAVWLATLRLAYVPVLVFLPSGDRNSPALTRPAGSCLPNANDSGLATS